MKYPRISFSSRNIPRENGGAVYAIIQYRNPQSCQIKGYISKTRWGSWQVDIASRHYGQRITDTKRFADAKQMARDLLA